MKLDDLYMGVHCISLSMLGRLAKVHDEKPLENSVQEDLCGKAMEFQQSLAWAFQQTGAVGAQ